MRLTIIKFFIRLLFRVEITGKYLGGEKNGNRKTLIIANHTSFLDGVLLALFLPEKPIFVVHRESVGSFFFRWLLKDVDYLLVDPEHPMVMRQVLRTLNAGRPLVIFPEGRVTVTGSLMKLYSGAAFAALKTQATIIPVQISGAEHSYFSRLSHIFNLRAFPKLRLHIFPPTRLKFDTNLAEGNDAREKAKVQMQRLMMEMMVEARERMTLFDMLLLSCKTQGGDDVVYKDEMGGTLTYADLVKQSVSLSLLLRRKQNLSKRVGLMLPNSNVGALVFYALQHSGKVPVMINYTAGSRAILSGLLACQVETIITSKRFIKKADLQSQIDVLGEFNIIYLEDLRKQLGVVDKVSIAVLRYFPKWTVVRQKTIDEAVVLFTSGTEGLPKGVVHSHDSLMTNVTQIKAIFDLNPQDRFMVCLPVFHVFGLMGGFILPIALGSSAWLYPSPLHYRTVPERIYEYSCTVLFSTSTFLEGYAKFAEPFDFHSLRYVVAGAEKLSIEVARIYLEKFGIRVIEGYGATETAPVISANTPMYNRGGSVGKILPAMSFELVPVEGIESGGRLVVRSDNVMLGYLRADNPGVIESVPVVDNKREYDTGDIVDVDEDGFIHIKGRVKRFAKLAGEMISLDSVEKMVVQADPSGQHAVISVADRRKGEQLILFTTGNELTVKKLQQTAKSLGMPKLAVPRKLIVIEEIPLFPNGKTNYLVLQAKL